MDNMTRNIEENSYLSFNLGYEEFALHVKCVVNILELSRITKVPKTQDFIKGVMNLRGEILTIIDLRLKIGLPKTKYTKNTCIIVVELKLGDQYVKMGLLVDNVISVRNINQNSILVASSVDNNSKSEFLSGMYKNGENILMIIDLNKMFLKSELELMQHNYKEEKII
jgi:purine-binding chemotaxis protein CheW